MQHRHASSKSKRGFKPTFSRVHSNRYKTHISLPPSQKKKKDEDYIWTLRHHAHRYREQREGWVKWVKRYKLPVIKDVDITYVMVPIVSTVLHIEGS